MKVLVHVHIYYTWMWDELKECVHNISLPYDLFVTMVDNNEELKQKILNFNSQAQIHIVEHRGYDVWPFIDVLNHVNLIM